MLSRLRVTMISVHFLTLSTLSQSSSGCYSLGCRGKFRVGRETEAGLHMAGDTLYIGVGSKDSLQRTMDAGYSNQDINA